MTQDRNTGAAAPVLEIELFGGVTLRRNGRQVTSVGSRSRKVWLLLAYLVCNRGRAVLRDELAEVLWPGQAETSASGLKTASHRARTLLEELDPAQGRSLLALRDGGYAWEDLLPYTQDTDRFEQLCRDGLDEAAGPQRLDALLEAAGLYKNGFLPELAGEVWAAPRAAYYQNLYLQAVQQALDLLEAAARWEEILPLCQAALGNAPYLEELYCRQMRALAELGRPQEAVQLYEQMTHLLYDSFGVQPSEEAQQLARAASRALNESRVAMNELLGRLREQEDEPGGAMLCDYDFFRSIYQATARTIARSGDAVHLCLFTLAERPGEELSRRSRERCMDNLGQVACASLRRGDIVSRCSGTQYIVMLNQANYENSCMVCERIQRAFTRRYPHAQADLRCTVQPIEPNL